MTFWQYRALLSDWLKYNPAPEEGSFCLLIMKRLPPRIVYMTLAAWRTGITLLHCDDSLFRILGEIRQSAVLSGEMLRRLPFWGFWLDFLADTVASSHRKSLCRFWEMPGPVPRSGRHHERRKPVHQGTALHAHRHLRPHVRKVHWQSYWKGKPTHEVEKSMLLKWKSPKIINGRDDDSLDAVFRFKNQINKSA